MKVPIITKKELYHRNRISTLAHINEVFQKFGIELQKQVMVEYNRHAKIIFLWCPNEGNYDCYLLYADSQDEINKYDDYNRFVKPKKESK